MKCKQLGIPSHCDLSFSNPETLVVDGRILIHPRFKSGSEMHKNASEMASASNISCPVGIQRNRISSAERTRKLSVLILKYQYHQRHQKLTSESLPVMILMEVSGLGKSGIQKAEIQLLLA